MSKSILSPNDVHFEALSNRVKEILVPLTAGQEWDTADLWILGRRIQDTIDSIQGGTIKMTDGERRVFNFIDENAC